MSILVSAGVHREGFIIVLEGPIYGRREDLHRLGFQYTEPGGYWYSFFDLKTLTILESWPEVRLTAKASNIAHRIEEARRERTSKEGRRYPGIHKSQPCQGCRELRS
jgi:hypothetical protein